MKKTIVTLFSFLFLLAGKAQVATFLSSGVAILEKDAKGNFSEVKRAIIQEIHITVDLSQKKVQLRSRGMLDSDTFSLRREISTLNEIPSPDINNDQMTRVFSGIDKQRKKCIVRLKPVKDEYKMHEGELQIEYSDHAEIYRLRTFRHNPGFIEN